jgi:integrase
MRDYILMLLFTGLRRGEAAGLRWADVDFTSRTIKLPARRTKAKRPLNLPMTDFVHDLLVALRALGTENEFVFPGDGASGHLREPKKAFAEIAKTCGVRVSPHDLRRTFISIAADTAIPTLALKGLVNHAIGGDVTENYARGFGTEQLRAPAQAVADKIKAYAGIAPPKGAVALRRK